MPLQPAPPGFEHINRYFDAPNRRHVAKLLPGQFFLSRDLTIVTVVGTCVVACIRDRTGGLGGVNHFLEPYGATGGESSPGEVAMLDLVMALLDAGAQRRHLEAKLYGGACIMDDGGELAARSIESARQFLRHADIPMIEEDVGGPFPRKIVYVPADGRVRIKHLRDIRNDTILARDLRFLGTYRVPAAADEAPV